MRKLIKNIFWIAAAMVLTLQSARAFSILGPGVGGGAAGDSWERPIIDYGVGGDVGTPKNIGEEYRRVTPIMYYAMDSTFITFFGLAGTTNIDAAFAVMNGALCGQTNNPLFLNTPTNGILSDYTSPYSGTPITLSPASTLDSYSTDLADFPLESQQFNYFAQALLLTDLKSSTLALLVEQMGLAQPERYTWTLHDRFLDPIPGAKCPGDEEYLVVQRNFDIIDSPLNQLQYSPYVNDVLYTYQIFEDCTGPNPLAGTIVTPVDLYADSYTAVASDDLFDGGFYTGLTRDDIAGMRYLLSSNNINYEATAPSGGLLWTTNVQAPQLFGPTLPISLLFSQSLFSDPNTLLALYPGITYLSVSTNIVNLVTTNITAYFTNLPPPYTNSVAFSNGAAVYPTNGIVPFTNWSPVQYGPAVLLTTQPLGPLLALAPFTDPATLELLYPGLLIGDVFTNFLGVVIVTNIFPYFTNQSVAPLFSNIVSGGLPNVTHLTNIYYFTNQPGPTVLNYDITVPFTTISTLDLATFVDLARTSSPAVLQTFYPGLEILRATTSPAFVGVTNYISYLTNLTGTPYSSPPRLVTVAVSTNYIWITNWNYTFGNVFTNHYSTNRLIRIQNIWITNLIGAPYGSPFIALTNYTTITNRGMISGDFFLIPTNWCGFDLTLAFPLGNPPYQTGPTNTIIYPGYNPSTKTATGTNNVAGGNSFGLTQNIYDIYTNYNYAVYPGICEPIFQLGTNYTTNVIYEYQYDFFNIVTNHYYTNTFDTVFTTNVQACPGGSPDLLCTNIQVSSFYTNLPSGDFYIVPPTWCGYQIISLLTNDITSTNFIVATNVASGTNGSQFIQVIVSSYTNYTYSIRPGFCEPALAFATNDTTNIVSEYSYYFGNIVTNHYFTNGPVTVITTNYATWTNGLVGWITNIVTTNVFDIGIGGDFYIVPPNLCSFTILATQLNTIVFSTNTFTATTLPGVTNFGQQYSQTTITSYTNSIFDVLESTCGTATPPAALRRGIGRVEFIRANYDSLLGQFFQPLTNYYTMVMITNSQQVTEYYQRVVTQPDFLLRAQDLTGGPSTATPGLGGVARNLRFDQSQILPGLAGPGTILPGTTFTYDKVGDLYANGSQNLEFVTTNGFLSQLNQGSFWGITNGLTVFLWASFDGSTNDPIVYPNGTSIANVVNQLYLQVTPSTVPDGTNGVPYNGGAGVTFTASGGQSPYTWAAPSLSATVPGMSFNPATATLSGTPTATGTFSFILQVTDAVNRVVNLNYSIIIH